MSNFIRKPDCEMCNRLEEFPLVWDKNGVQIHQVMNNGVINTFPCPCVVPSYYKFGAGIWMEQLGGM
jgi:hypothetical protein